MSRLYEMRIEVEDYDKKYKEAIQAALLEEWGFDDFYASNADDVFTTSMQNNLCGGESEDEFADRIARVVWRANRKFCLVTVHATFLESLPYESYIRDEQAYEQLMSGAPDEPEAAD